MGSTKEWLMEVEHERMLNWIRENYKISDTVEIDEDHPDFYDMVNAYQDKIYSEEYEAEMKWFEEHPLLETFSVFNENLKYLKMLVRQHDQPLADMTIHRMIYAHAVTLFEAMVGDIIKTTILNCPLLKNRFIENSGEDRTKYTMREIATLGLDGIIMKTINTQTFHNPLTVKKYVNLVTSRVLPDTNMAQITKVIEIRHDFVHRNGKNIDGTEHEVNTQLVIESIETIERFAKDVFDTLSDAIDEVTPSI